MHGQFVCNISHGSVIYDCYIIYNRQALKAYIHLELFMYSLLWAIQSANYAADIIKKEVIDCFCWFEDVSTNSAPDKAKLISVSCSATQILNEQNDSTFISNNYEVTYACQCIYIAVF